jgi:hypothetical protein
MTPTETLGKAILELSQLGRVTDETHAELVECVTSHSDELRFADIEDRLKALENPKSTTSKKGS